MVKEFCVACGGEHEPDSDEVYVDYKGYRFKKPFRCMCCGKEICARQFAYGRCCGSCDIGACQTGNRAFRLSTVHERPSWVVPCDRQASIDKFAEATMAEKVKIIAMPDLLPSSIWATAWATLYSIFGQRLEQTNLDLMDSVLQSVEADARASLRPTTIKDINEGEC